jgi:hypothetical protein
MLISDVEAPVGPSLKFIAAAAAMIMLAGCAVKMPFPPLATSSPHSQFACNAGSKCTNETKNPWVANHRSRPIDRVRIDDNPPDFIVNGSSITE